MNESYPPGTVAMIEAGCWANTHKAFRTQDGWIYGPRGVLASDDVVSNVRPLVVIDPEDREQVERLAKAMHESDHIAPWHDLHNETRSQIEDAMQAALREFANPTPPKPDEPTGLGAVVETAGGERWVRTTTPDRDGDHLGKPWSDGIVRSHWQVVPAVRVLSEGVQP